MWRAGESGVSTVMISDLEFPRMSRSLFELWNILMDNDGDPMPADVLYRHVMGYDELDQRAELNCGREMIFRLRRLLPDGCIKVVRGHGYIFVDRQVEEEVA